MPAYLGFPGARLAVMLTLFLSAVDDVIHEGVGASTIDRDFNTYIHLGNSKIVKVINNICEYPLPHTSLQEKPTSH